MLFTLTESWLIQEIIDLKEEVKELEKEVTKLKGVLPIV